MAWGRLISATAALCLVWAAALTPTAAQGPAAELRQAEEAYRQNVALGESLEGKPATADQAAEAERLFQEALSKARECISQDPRSAEGHRMAGVILCMAYRPVSVPADEASEGPAAEPDSATMTILRRGGVRDCEEGLAELRAALRLEKSKPAYYLDYAEALYVCGDLDACQEQATAIWGHRSSMSNLECARCACLLADCASSRNETDVEMRWLREAVRYNPQDDGTRQRLAGMMEAQPRIVWLSYETGKALAASEEKPMLIDFSASWCGWCRKLERDVFPRPDVISFCRQLVCIKVDGDQRRDLTSAYRVDGYPTAIVLDHTGQELHRIVGYRPAAEYLAELRRTLPGP